MASPAPVRYALLGAGISALALALLQTLLAQRLERAQIAQMGPEVAFNLRLAELALDRLPPQALARLSGLPLLIGERPPISTDGRLRRQADQLRRDLCQRLDPCPPVLPAAVEVPGLWVEVLSPLERVWLLAPVGSPRRWPPDPLLLAAALLAGGVHLGLIADGVHVAPTMAVLLQRLADDQLVLVSDALAPYGLADGRHRWDERELLVEQGTCRLPDGTLAGVTLPLLEGVRRLARWGGEAEASIAAATVSPRRVLGDDRPIESLLVGMPLAETLRWSGTAQALAWRRSGPRNQAA